MKPRKKRTLTAAEKRALASSGLMVTRYAPDGGRATVEELVADDSKPSSFFANNRKHTFVEDSEGGQP